MPTQNIWLATTSKLCERNPCWKKTARKRRRKCLGSSIHHYGRECDMTYKEQALKQSDMPGDPRTPKTNGLKQPEHLVGAHVPRMRRDTGQEYAKLEGSKVSSVSKSEISSKGTWKKRERGSFSRRGSSTTLAVSRCTHSHRRLESRTWSYLSTAQGKIHLAIFLPPPRAGDK